MFHVSCEQEQYHTKIIITKLIINKNAHDNEIIY